MKFQIHGADLTHARNLRKAPTSAERVVWSMLRAGRFRGLKFHQQHRLGPFIVDFYCANLSLAIANPGIVLEAISGILSSALDPSP